MVYIRSYVFIFWVYFVYQLMVNKTVYGSSSALQNNKQTIIVIYQQLSGIFKYKNSHGCLLFPK